jgi:hypothetical protein
MSAAERQLNPSEFSDETVRALAVALIPHLNRFGIEEKPMRQDDIAKMLGVSVKTIIGLTNRGVIKACRFEGLSTPFYYPSEINRELKKRKS